MKLSFAHRLAGSCAIGCELCAVAADVGHFVRHDQVVLGIHCRLHVVADDAGAAALVAMDRASGSVSESCASGLA